MVKSETRRDVKTFFNSHQFRTDVGCRREKVEFARLLLLQRVRSRGGIGAKIELCQKYSTTRKYTQRYYTSNE